MTSRRTCRRTFFVVAVGLTFPSLASAVELPAGACGQLVTRRMSSRSLGAPREVQIYFPAEYQRDRARRFPVLYLQDGQNLIPKRGWDLCSAVDRHSRSPRGEPVIIVAIPNSGARRAFEYTPSFDPGERTGGGADAYVRFIADELKPWVDRTFRTRRDARATGIGGSSLGGLVALHAALSRPDVFGRVMAMSPSLWWNGCEMLRRVEAMRALPRGLKIYMDSGGSGRQHDGCRDVFRLRDLLASKNMQFGSDLWHWFERGHSHNEKAWRERLPRALGALFPAGQ